MSNPYKKLLRLARLMPECAARRDVSPERGVYFCAHPNFHSPANLVNASICALCTKRNEPMPDDLLPFSPPPGMLSDRPCVHLGDKIGEQDCDSCRGRTRIKVFQCTHPHYEKTTLQKCQLCPDFVAQRQDGLPAAEGNETQSAY